MLDVSLRFGVLSLLRQIREESNLALLYVTHDISTARYFADRIVVLYAGRAVEEGAADEVVLDPKHPYTKMLIAAAPDPRRVADLVTRRSVNRQTRQIHPADAGSILDARWRCRGAHKRTLRSKPSTTVAPSPAGFSQKKPAPTNTATPARAKARA